MERKILEDLTDVVHRLTSVTEDIERKYERRDENILVSCNEAARLLGRNPSTISEMIREKRLEKVTIGRSTGIRLSEIKRLINRREAQEP